LLLVPTGERLSPEDGRIADSRVLGFVRCREVLSWDASRKLVTTISIERALAGTTTSKEPVTPDLPPDPSAEMVKV
jgi:hypothetical protein